MSKRSGARRYFWFIVIVAALLICGMIYYLSMAQAKEEKASQMLESQLNEQILSSEDLKEDAMEISKENETLKEEIEANEQEILGLYKENKKLSSFSELQTLYINGGSAERIKILLEEIDKEGLSAEQKQAYEKIEESLN